MSLNIFRFRWAHSELLLHKEILRVLDVAGKHIAVAVLMFYYFKSKHRWIYLNRKIVDWKHTCILYNIWSSFSLWTLFMALWISYIMWKWLCVITGRFSFWAVTQHSYAAIEIRLDNRQMPRFAEGNKVFFLFVSENAEK